MAISKVVFGGDTLIDLTNDTVTAGKLLEGITAHSKDGEVVTGSCTFDADTKDATAQESEVLAGKTYYANGVKKTGIMINNEGVTGAIKTKEEAFNIPAGHHDGSGKVSIDPTEQSKIIPGNIRDGVTILGVEGTMSGIEGVKTQAKTVTPSKLLQTILPDEAFNYLSQVTVNAIPYAESQNPAGGTTVTIG